jgi:hypothetical protein
LQRRAPKGARRRHFESAALVEEKKRGRQPNGEPRKVFRRTRLHEQNRSVGILGATPRKKRIQTALR